MILVTAATRQEIEPFIAANKSAEILITGVGIPATIFHLTKRLSENKYDLVIQAGIGGTFNNVLQMGDVVAINKDTFADLGIYEKEKLSTLFDAGFIDKDEFPFENGWLYNKNSETNNFRLPVADSITINTITDDKKRIDLLHRKFNATVETMEGAAFHYVCLQYNQKFLQVRSISNIVGERDKSKWKMKEAIQNLNKSLLKIFEEI